MSLAFGAALPDVARRAIRSFVAEGKSLNASEPAAPAAPVFVTLRGPDGALRGCIGTLAAAESDVFAETARNAVAAATRDPRFPPVSQRELDSLQVEVSVLLPEEPVSGVDELDPQRYGVIVRNGRGRQGVLLPNVPGIETAEAQVDIAREKANISPTEPLSLARFSVEKFR